MPNSDRLFTIFVIIMLVDAAHSVVVDILGIIIFILIIKDNYGNTSKLVIKSIRKTQ